MSRWDEIKSYDVIYTVPGQTDRSAMPVGNGELCASVWMETDGVLRLYFSRSDALLENDRTAKLGCIEIRTEEGFLSEGGFEQRLSLEDGRIVFTSRLGEIVLFVSKRTDTIEIRGDFYRQVNMRASYRTWRLHERQDVQPWTEPVVIRPDTVEETADGIRFYHRNGANGIAKLAALEEVTDLSHVPDFLTGRIFGGLMRMEDSVWQDHCLLRTGQHFTLQVLTLSGQYPDAAAWKKQLAQTLAQEPDYETALRQTGEYWSAFWQKSYIFVDGDESVTAACTEEIRKRAQEPMECNPAPSQVTRAYLLTRYMIACCKDGHFPLLYNGLLFNLTPGNREHLKVASFAGTYTSQPAEEADEEFNPDERSWAVEQLWQNLRLPYYTMLATGDFESLRKMFAYYLRFRELNRDRAKAYHQAEGQFTTEMTLTCGLQSGPEIYGLERTGKKPGEAANLWGGSIQISPGLEFLNLMLDYCSYTDDPAFLENEVTSYARDLFRYIETRFRKRRDGKLWITDINCIETYFHTDDPTPIVAGMHCTLEKLLQAGIPEQDKQYFREIRELTPPVPLSQGEHPVILPAQLCTQQRMNVESPELYAVYPFGICRKMRGNEQVAVDTFSENMQKYDLLHPFTIGNPPGSTGYAGWQYMGNVAAMLGMTDTAAEILRQNCTLQNPGNRFPAMWGAVHDAVPDADHGANIMNLLQLMLLQCDGGHISLLPAFPKHWRVKFRLYAPHGKVVTGSFDKGQMEISL